MKVDLPVVRQLNGIRFKFTLNQCALGETEGHALIQMTRINNRGMSCFSRRDPSVHREGSATVLEALA